jgi:type I restriction enzyme S subunit
MSSSRTAKPGEWTRIQLADALETLENGSRPKGGIKKIEHGVPSIGGEHLDGDGGFKLQNVSLVPEKFFQGLRRGKIKRNDVLLVKDGATTGKVSIARDDFPFKEAAVNEHIFILRGKKEIIDQKFLYYHLQSARGQRQILASFHGAAIGGINTQFARNYTLLLPSLPQQKKTAEILDKVRTARVLRAQADELTGSFLNAVFHYMFGDPSKNRHAWPVTTLDDVCTEIVDCPHSTPKYAEQTTRYACIRTSELKDGNIDWTSMKYLNEHRFRERTRRLLPKEGDIIYGREGTFGEAAIVPKGVNICLGQRVMLFRPDRESYTPEYLWSLVRSPFVYRQALKVTSGSTVGHVNVKEITKFRIVCPPLEIQKTFSTIAKGVQSLRQEQQLSSVKIGEIIAATLQKAFTGASYC